MFVASQATRTWLQTFHNIDDQYISWAVTYYWQHREDTEHSRTNYCKRNKLNNSYMFPLSSLVVCIYLFLQTNSAPLHATLLLYSQYSCAEQTCRPHNTLYRTCMPLHFSELFLYKNFSQVIIIIITFNRVFVIMYRKQTVFLRYTVLQLFCVYSVRYTQGYCPSLQLSTNKCKYITFHIKTLKIAQTCFDPKIILRELRCSLLKSF